VHGLGGSSLLFRLLAEELGDEQPVYCLKLPSGVVSDRNDVSIRTLASKYLAEIRAVHPFGVFHLGGHSFGGLIAFEMANQLARNNQSLGLLALLDSDRNIGRPDTPARDERESPKMRLRRWKAKGESLIEKGVAEVIRRRLEYMKLKKRVRDAERTLPDEISKRTFEADELLVLAAAGYKPSPYSGNAVLFRARDEVRTASDNALGWASLVRGKLEIVDVPGKHLSAFDQPNVATLALRLEEQMDSTTAFDREKSPPLLHPARIS
jgi:thioesterase domain-containing protein